MEPKLPAPRIRTPLTPWLIGVTLIVLTIFLFLSLSAPQEQTLAWLPVTDLSHPAPPSALTKIKNQFLRLTAPIWGRFQRNKPQILTTVGVFNITSAASEQISLGTPVSTNADGTRAWIVNHAELLVFNQCLKTNLGATRVSSPRLQCADGQQAGMSLGQSIPAGVTPLGTNWIRVGVIVDLLSKLRGDTVQTTVLATSSDLAGQSTNGNPVIQTNFALACRALIPNGGALIVDSGGSANTTGTNYWLTLSPTAIDARGVPIKH